MNSNARNEVVFAIQSLVKKKREYLKIKFADLYQKKIEEASFPEINQAEYMLAELVALEKKVQALHNEYQEKQKKVVKYYMDTNIASKAYLIGDLSGLRITLDKKQDELVELSLLDAPELGQQLKDIRDLEETLNLKILLATTETKLSAFLQQIADTLSI